MKKAILTSAMIGILLSTQTLAFQIPKSLSTDPRMKVVAYTPGNVVEINGNQLIETSLEFGEAEAVIGVEGGDAAGWSVSINKQKPNIVFIKPIVDLSDTNLTVLTNRRVYHFHLVSSSNSKDNAPPIYNVRFFYPDEIKAQLDAEKDRAAQEKDSIVNDDLKNPLNWNWDYSFSGKCAKDFVPKKVFDDGEFTYFEFSPHTEMPAIFVVDEAGHESLANWHMKGHYVVVQRVSRQFSLRNGRVTSCVFNDAYKA